MSGLQELNLGARERGWWDKCKDDVSANYLNYVGSGLGLTQGPEGTRGDVAALGLWLNGGAVTPVPR